LASRRGQGKERSGECALGGSFPRKLSRQSPTRGPSSRTAKKISPAVSVAPPFSRLRRGLRPQFFQQLLSENRNPCYPSSRSPNCTRRPARARGTFMDWISENPDAVPALDGRETGGRFLSCLLRGGRQARRQWSTVIATPRSSPGVTRVAAHRIAQPPKASLSRGSGPASRPAKPPVSYQINRHLPGWNLPPQALRAFGAHLKAQFGQGNPRESKGFFVAFHGFSWSFLLGTMPLRQNPKG
jgi:hypothetical protein